jgi:hypothetical protein
VLEAASDRQRTVIVLKPFEALSEKGVPLFFRQWVDVRTKDTVF